MNIEFENGKETSRNVWFPGTLDNGVTFTVCANWNDWDGWTVDEVTWEEGEGTDEDVEAITQKFVEEMNS